MAERWIVKGLLSQLRWSKHVDVNIQSKNVQFQFSLLKDVSAQCNSSQFSSRGLKAIQKRLKTSYSHFYEVVNTCF